MLGPPPDREVAPLVNRSIANVRAKRIELGIPRGSIGFKSIIEKLDGMRELGLASALKPDFLKKTADDFTDEVP